MFNEANTLEDYLCHLLSGTAPTTIAGRASDVGGNYTVMGRNRAEVGWHYLPAISLPRQPNDVFIETFVCNALIRLNPEIAANCDRAEDRQCFSCAYPGSLCLVSHTLFSMN